MQQPYALFRDSRTGSVFAVAADRQSKILVAGGALAVDQLNLQQHGYSGAILDANVNVLHEWLDTIPDA